MDNLQGSEDQLQHSNVPSDTPDEALHCIDELREAVEKCLKQAIAYGFEKGYTNDTRPDHVRANAIRDELTQFIMQDEQALTKSLLAEVEERGPKDESLIGISQTKMATILAHRNAVNARWRKTLNTIRQERLGTKEENLKDE